MMATLGLAAASLSGCYRVSPLVGSGEDRRASATPPPVTAERRSAVFTEATLAQLARAAGQAGIAAVHTGHATVLAQVDPLAGRSADTTPVIPVTPSSPASPSTVSPQLQLITAERVAGRDYLEIAGRSDDPSWTLIWASLTVFANSVRFTGPAPELGDAYPVTVPSEPLTAARQVLLSRLNALSTGLEWGVGRLSSTDPLHATGVDRLRRVEYQKASLRASLRAASASPTPLQPGYPMPATPSDAASTRTLWSGLERGALAGWGRVTAAADGADRRAAMLAMSRSMVFLSYYGVPQPGWPGWV